MEVTRSACHLSIPITDPNESAALPLSSRAQPRDLQFYGPFGEMFFCFSTERTQLRTHISRQKTS